MKNLLLLMALFLTSVISKAATYYVATTGSDSNPGTLAAPFKTIQKLNSVLVAGDIAYIRGGTYPSAAGNGASTHFSIQNLTGTAANPIKIWAYPGETPMFDCSNITPTNGFPFAFAISSSKYVHVKGLTIKNLKQIASGSGVSRGFALQGSDNCTVELLNVFNIGGTGVTIINSNNPTFLNCDSHNNGDGMSPDQWNFGDGFTCTGGDASTNILFDGCRAWMNGDDNWDFFAWSGMKVTIRNCWAFWASVKPWGPSGTQPSEAGITPSDPSLWANNTSYRTSTVSGEGFKLGGFNAGGPGPAGMPTTLKKYLDHCVSFENSGTGYSANMAAEYSHQMQLLNCIAYGNGNDGYGFATGRSVGIAMIFKNCIGTANNKLQSGGDWAYDGLSTNVAKNVWTTTYNSNYGNLAPSIQATSADFQSTSSAGVTGARQSDGTLPNLTFLKLAAGSDLIDAGVNVGLTYAGNAPDVGPFESNGSVAANVLPVANAGTDITLTLPTNAVTLNGSGTDPDGTITAYSWTQVSGPTSGTISNGATASVTAIGLVQGIYQYQLKVTDNRGGTSTDNVAVVVNPYVANTAPVANAGADQTITLPTSSVSLSGSGTDAGGSITAYAWTKVSGPTGGTITSPSAATTTITALVQGTYKFQLKVTDNGGATGGDTIQVIVNPAAAGGANNAYGGTRWAIPGTIQAENFDIGGQNVDYYDNTNGNNGGVYRTTDYVDIAAATEGGYLIGWIEKDEWMKYSVNVTAAGTYSIQARVAASAAGSFRIEMDGTTIATVNVPNTGGSQAFQTVTIANIALTAGNKTMRVYAVTAGYNLNFFTFTKTSGGNAAPIANAGADKTISLPTVIVSLSGSGTDVDGTIASYAWTKLSGPTGGTIASALTAVTNITALIQGVYKFELKVTDNAGAIGRDTVQVTVNALASPNNAYGGTRWTIPGIIQAENFDNGGQNVAYYDNSNGNNGGVYRTTDYVDIATATEESSPIIGWIAANEWMKYSVNVVAAGKYTLQARVAAAAAGKSFRVEMDGVTIATVTVPNTGSTTAWQTVSIPNITLTAGDKTMRIYALASGSFNINYVSFVSGTSRMAETDELVTEAVNTTVTTFPLPFSTSFAVSLYGETKGDYNLTLVNASGTTVWTKKITKSNETVTENIYMGNYPNGVYILQVVSPDKTKSAHQLIKN